MSEGHWEAVDTDAPSEVESNLFIAHQDVEASLHPDNENGVEPPPVSDALKEFSLAQTALEESANMAPHQAARIALMRSVAMDKELARMLGANNE